MKWISSLVDHALLSFCSIVCHQQTSKIVAYNLGYKGGKVRCYSYNSSLGSRILHGGMKNRQRAGWTTQTTHPSKPNLIKHHLARMVKLKKKLNPLLTQFRCNH